MQWKKLGKALLLPHIAIAVALLPLATVMLVGSMLILGSNTPVAYLSYLLASYTLTVWCIRLPALTRALRRFWRTNPHALRWQRDARLRVKVSLYTSLAWNTLYGVFQLWLGLYHRTFWFTSLGAYYICLAVMRFALLGHTRRHAPREEMLTELRKYRTCGWVFLLINLALSLIVFFMVYWNRTFVHHMITAIAMAAYTFTALTVTVIGMVRYRRYASPVFSASRAISLSAALVSMLTLEATMLTTFGDGSMTPLMRKWMLGATGGAISAVIVGLGIYMIVTGTKKINQLKKEDRHEQ